jgi:hypothetical protein
MQRYFYGSMFFVVSLVPLCFGALQLTPEGSINIYSTTPINGITLSQNGNVGAGVINPVYKLDVNGTLSANSTNLTGTLNVVGLSTFTDISINNTLSVNMINTIINQASIAGNLTVNGTLSANRFIASRTTVNSTLTVTGLVTMTSLTVNGTLSTNSLFASGQATVGSLSCNGTVSANLFAGSAAKVFNISLNYYEVYDSAAATLASAGGTVVMTSMSITPGKGTYFVMFNSSAHQSTNVATLTYSIYANGAQVANSVRTIRPENIANDRVLISTSGFATVAAGQAIDIRWTTSSGTASVYNRGLNLVRVK